MPGRRQTNGELTEDDTRESNGGTGGVRATAAVDFVVLVEEDSRPQEADRGQKVEQKTASAERDRFAGTGE